MHVHARMALRGDRYFILSEKIKPAQLFQHCQVSMYPAGVHLMPVLVSTSAVDYDK